MLIAKVMMCLCLWGTRGCCYGEDWSNKMGSFRSLRLLFASTFLGVLLAPDDARAYVDPGAGNTLFALITGGVGSLVVVWHLFGDSVRRLFTNCNSKRSDPDQ